MSEPIHTAAFELRRDDLRESRFVEDSAVTELDDGEALLEVEHFGLTANNVTYAVFGESMNYWDFFPASQEGWGRLPVWGFARVVESRNPGLASGGRVYGYLPAASHLKVVPGRVDERGFVDAAPHRADLPSAYHAFRSIESDPAYRADREDEQILFWPLFYTSFLVDDLFADEAFYGAETIALSSASSKTALIAAFLLAQREGARLVGLTSPGNAEWVRELGVYDEVLPYDEVSALPAEKLAYADFSGDAAVRRAVHGHAGKGLVSSTAIGATHWEEMKGEQKPLPGPRPKFFFAPDRVRKRGEEWSRAELERRVNEAWHPFADWSTEWIEVRKGRGQEDFTATFTELLDGKVGPAAGPVHTLLP